jgi:hypothetical protein
VEWKDGDKILIGNGKDGKDSDLFYGIIPP